MFKFRSIKPIAFLASICAIAVIFSSSAIVSQPKSTVRFRTDPPISQILPFEAEAAVTPAPTRLTLQALDPVGHPLPNAKIHLQILAPEPTPWFTTDFPNVEGTKLLDMEAIAPNGELQVQQMLPIRGTYRLQVNITPTVTQAFAPFQQTLSLDVPENPVKYRYFAILAIALLVMGLGGGWIIGGKQKVATGEIAPQRVRLLLSGMTVLAIGALLFVNISAEIAESHGTDHNHDHGSIAHQAPDAQNIASSQAGIKRSQGLEVRLVGDRQAIVGQPADLKVQVIDTKTNQPITDALLHVKTTAVEGEWVALDFQAVTDTKGELQWLETFLDGAPHKLEVAVSPKTGGVRQFQPFQVAQEIDVEGVAPSLTVRFITLFYLTSIIVVGLAIGLQLKRRSAMPTKSYRG
jgi:hypothetical protein